MLIIIVIRLSLKIIERGLQMLRRIWMFIKYFLIGCVALIIAKFWLGSDYYILKMLSIIIVLDSSIVLGDYLNSKK